jgi:glutamate formiminotransferase/formiminotetrahydrofolate cyclodeaminase
MPQTAEEEGQMRPKSTQKRTIRQQALEEFAKSVASGFGPGGGSTASAAAAIAAATAAKAARLSALKRPVFEKDGKALDALAQELMKLAQADDEAYAAYLKARKMPQATPAQKAKRAQAIAVAMKNALEIPVRAAELSAQIVKISRRLAKSAPVAAVDAEIADGLAAACAEGNLLLAHENLGFIKDKLLASGAKRRIRAVERAVRRAPTQH